MDIISVINYKGGVGKTTLTANIAGELAYSVPSIEVFFSVEFVYREIGSERNLFGTIDHGIDAIMALLEELNRTIGGKVSKTRELVVEKINDLHFHKAPKDFWFIDDYVFIVKTMFLRKERDVK